MNLYEYYDYYYNQEHPMPKPKPKSKPLPDMTADWKAIRRLSDAINECVDNTVNDLVEWVGLDLTEEEVEHLFDRVLNLATTGEEPPNPALALECSDCGHIVRSIQAAADHEAETEPGHGGWDTTS